MADARATEEETEVDEMSIVRTGSIANHVNAKKFEMALHKSESLADYPAEKVWKHVDVDKSGGLDKKEFFEMYQLLQKHVDTQQKELVEEKHKIWESQVRLRMFKYFGLFLLFTMILLFATNILTGYASIKLGQQFSDINMSDPILRMRDGAAAECGNPDFTLGASANFWEGVREAYDPEYDDPDTDDLDDDEMANTALVGRNGGAPVATMETMYTPSATLFVRRPLSRLCKVTLLPQIEGTHPADDNKAVKRFLGCRCR